MARINTHGVSVLWLCCLFYLHWGAVAGRRPRLAEWFLPPFWPPVDRMPGTMIPHYTIVFAAGHSTSPAYCFLNLVSTLLCLFSWLSGEPAQSYTSYTGRIDTQMKSVSDQPWECVVRLSLLRVSLCPGELPRCTFCTTA